MRNSHAPGQEERVERIRGAVQDSIDAVGLRPTARAIGLSPTGAKNFALGSSMPYRPGWTRLQEWFEWWSAQVPAPNSEVIVRAIHLLTRDLPDAVAAQSARRSAVSLRASTRIFRGWRSPREHPANGNLLHWSGRAGADGRLNEWWAVHTLIARPTPGEGFSGPKCSHKANGRCAKLPR